ncbi:MAG: 50S ribosomal protein L11 methyltransferase [Pyrinomonadaceae bacterium]|nr:50S ribosomal protein L11 methyltransferase [Pyrinomonadaceae bacterium]
MIKNQERWFALEITVDLNATEAIEFALNELDSLGTEIKDFGQAQSENVTVIGYFNEKPGNEILQNQLTEALRIYGFSHYEIKKTEWRGVENQDWIAEWKKHWKPTVTGKFIIAPPWEKFEDTDKIVICIEPGMAFGTGTHETTRLCLKAIEENYRNGETFYDVGTGTGILAIAVAKLTTKVDNQNSRTPFINACDTDQDSIDIALENAGLNEVGDKINFTTETISEKDSKFDFVCANLTADVIVPLLPLLIEKTKRILVLSGILKEQEDLILAELRKFKIERPKTETSGEWISVIVEN